MDCPLIFHRVSKGRPGQPIQDYRAAWKAACKEAGLPAGRDVEGGVVPYDLRRCAMRNMVRGGTDFTVAMKISGYRTRATFDRYNIVSEDDIRAAVLRTAEFEEIAGANLDGTRKDYLADLAAVRSSSTTSACASCPTPPPKTCWKW